MAQSVFPVPSTATPSLYSRTALITTSQTWAHPDGYAANRPVKVIIHGAGGGGGSGAAGASWGTTTYAAVGGYGGASGFCLVFDYVMSGDVAITIGAGGAGGAAVSGVNLDGNYGTGGGSTSFGSYLAPGGNGGPYGRKYSGGAELAYYAGSGGNVPASQRFDARYNAASSAYIGYAENGRFGSGSYYRAYNGTGWSYGQSPYVSGSANGTDTTTVVSTSYPQEGLVHLAGCGGSGGSLNNGQLTTPVTGAGNTGGTGSYAGGNGGSCSFTTTSTVPVATAGTAGTMGSGGGGGGAAASSTATSATSGAGGTGGNGWVRILY